MSTKNASTKPSGLSLRRPSAAQAVRVEEPKPAPVEEPKPAPVEEPKPAPVEEPKPAPVEEIVAAPTIAAQTIEAPRAPEPKPTLSREAERIVGEPDADFFVSIPKSKKNALKVHCAQAGISMRDWLLGVLNEKGIGTDDASKRAKNKG
jgi:hypothetical protein